MDSGKEDSHGDSISEETSNSSQSPVSCEPDRDDICGKQQKPPRIGHEYQVEIPPSILETEPFQLVKGLSEEGIMVDVADSFVEALPIPIMWINNVNDRRDDTNGSLNSKNTKPIRNEDKIYYAAPGCLGNSWTDLEKEAFLLGLYIFGKNLVMVKRFVESKAMADILSFYYGEFKGSEKQEVYTRTKMFKTWRQQKFLSCLLPRIPEKCHATLVEVSKNFEACNVSLEDYVSTLKATIGLAVLVEVFGIGKGKQDLTGLVTDPARNNQHIISHPEIPVVGFLTGDYRLSKARSNDLFWEAVWPRLLARGWQSKQPKNHIGTSSKNPLMFIVPGVKKFSRRKLVKGDKYFDSVADVLTKVASDPRLIELEDEPGKANIGSQENDCDNKKMKPEKGGNSDHKRSIYLQPQLPESNSDLMKFTVVDTSMGDGEDSFAVRELRSLPVQTTETSFPESLSSHSENGFKELAHEKGVVEMSLNCTRDTSTSRSSEGITDKEVRSDSLKFIITVSKKEMQIKAPVRADVSLRNDMDQSTCNPDMDSRTPIKSLFSQRKNPSQPNCLSPVIKRRRLTACCEAKAICSKDSSSKTRGVREEDPHLYLGSSNPSDNMVSEVTQSQEKVYSSSSGKCSPDENFFGKYISQKEKYPPRLSIDLNLPHVLSNVETDQPFIKEVEISQSDPSLQRPSSPASSELAGVEQQLPGLVGWRQGTRKRPLTAKALEAVACGFLTTKRKPR
ncbi:hypothetical protein MKW98_023540 [Papaver atlanticum]|uniref:SANT domain-containing protein n=1 Tax=Papaver atlanticum TaxID=357466 RepID=A0AAD4SZ15_9MAGN|nr:hypothetical protein MKW98_023540 [Papaver atlanticum]